MKIKQDKKNRIILTLENDLEFKILINRLNVPNMILRDYCNDYGIKYNEEIESFDMYCKMKEFKEIKDDL